METCDLADPFSVILIDKEQLFVCALQLFSKCPVLLRGDLICIVKLIQLGSENYILLNLKWKHALAVYIMDDSASLFNNSVAFSFCKGILSQAHLRNAELVPPVAATRTTLLYLCLLLLKGNVHPLYWQCAFATVTLQALPLTKPACTSHIVPT